MVPDLPGSEVLARLQIKLRQAMPPVIFATGRDSEDDIVRILMAGADDYIVKPFSPAQLVARIRAVLRRAGASAASGVLERGGWTLDLARHEVRWVGGEPVHLTGLETRLLEALMLNAGAVLTADALIQAVWGVEGGSRTMLKQLVYRLRAKLEAAGGGEIIETVPGVGYAFPA